MTRKLACLIILLFIIGGCTKNAKKPRVIVTDEAPVEEKEERIEKKGIEFSETIPLKKMESSKSMLSKREPFKGGKRDVGGGPKKRCKLNRCREARWHLRKSSEPEGSTFCGYRSRREFYK